MNSFNVKNMYDSLMDLCNENEEKKFYYVDHIADENHIYRIFNYQIPRYLDFQKPYAKECRGSMFLVNSNSMEMVRILALPMPKFFNFGENPSTSNIDLNETKEIALKADGSLISSYLDIDNKLSFKTKKDVNNKPFLKVIDSLLNDDLIKEINELSEKYTIDFELTSPFNRVILEYKESSLQVLKIRNFNTGEFLDIRSDNFKNKYPEICKITIPLFDLDTIKLLDLNNRTLDLKGIEGFVVEQNDGTLYKVKTKYYLSQNKFANIQDLSKYDKLLVEACINETFDELRTLFHYRNRSENYNIENILSKMDVIEGLVSSTFNPFIYEIKNFYENNKHLEQSEFIKLIQENPSLKKHFNLLMPMYKGLKYNLNEHYMKMIGNNLKSS